MFTEFPTYPRYRTLRLTSGTISDPLMAGEDVFALQTALNAIGLPVGTVDGILGKNTAAAIRQAQVNLKLADVDGLAGGKTQEALARQALKGPASANQVPPSAMRGQLEHESGFRLGNYSPIRSDGSYDAGVTQRNTAHTPASRGFNVMDSLEVLAQNTRKHFDLFEGIPSLRRRWALAQGAWNAPAFACFIARQEGAVKVTSGMVLRPSDTQRQTLEAYISDVSIYLSI